MSTLYNMNRLAATLLSSIHTQITQMRHNATPSAASKISW
jgi:hypothetical protein